MRTTIISIALIPLLVPARKGCFFRDLYPQPEVPIRRDGDINIERSEKSDPSKRIRLCMRMLKGEGGVTWWWILFIVNQNGARRKGRGNEKIVTRMGEKNRGYGERKRKYWAILGITARWATCTQQGKAEIGCAGCRMWYPGNFAYCTNWLRAT